MMGLVRVVTLATGLLAGLVGNAWAANTGAAAGLVATGAAATGALGALAVAGADAAGATVVAGFWRQPLSTALLGSRHSKVSKRGMLIMLSP